MGKRIVYLCIALLLLSLGLAAVPKTFSQVDNVKIINYSWYIDPEGYLEVVGLVQNNGANAISTVVLSGTVVGAGDIDLGDSVAQVWVSDLLPQQQAPFYMEFPSPHNIQDTAWYQAAADGEISSFSVKVASANETSSYQYQGLEITSSKGSIGTTGEYNGAYSVNGVIKNTGTQSATKLTVVGAFFNSSGAVVGVGYTNYLNPTVLVPGNTTTFQISAFDLNQSVVPAALQIKKYQLLVQTSGPILQGTAPIASPQATGTTGPTDKPNTHPSSNPKSNISNIFPFAVAAVIAVIVLVAVVAVVKQIMNRNARMHPQGKERQKSHEKDPLN